MSWGDQPVLVSGAGGFIGSTLVEALVCAGATVRGLVRYNARNDWGNLERLPAAIRNEIDVRLGDVRDPYVIREAARGVHTVFHLAALVGVPYSQLAPQSYVETNVIGTLNMLEAARYERVERFIHTSTSEVYGTAFRVPMDESHPLQAHSPYAATKTAADKLAESYYRSFGLPVATIRPFNAFGPRQSARAVIPSIAAQAINRPSIEVGALTPRRDFTYVTDIVAAYLLMAQTPAAVGDVVNIGTGTGIAISEVAARIQQLLGTSLPVIESAARIRPGASEIDTLICDNTRARRLLGWQPAVSFDEGIVRTIRWIKEHIDVYKTDIFNT